MLSATSNFNFYLKIYTKNHSDIRRGGFLCYNKNIMTFYIFTIFPEVFENYLKTSILGRAQKKKLIKVKIYDIRNFTKDRHHKTDDKPFGGGPGMVMKVEPILKAIRAVFGRKKQKPLIILTSASGKLFNQKMSTVYAKKYKEIAIICGHYEGIDARLKKMLRVSGYMVHELSVGPYILTGGELPAMTIVDAVSRHIQGVLGNKESLEETKGSYPVYTRPEILEYNNKKYRVPKILLSGNHKEIENWRKKNSKS